MPSSRLSDHSTLQICSFCSWLNSLHQPPEGAEQNPDFFAPKVAFHLSVVVSGTPTVSHPAPQAREHFPNSSNTSPGSPWVHATPGTSPFSLTLQCPLCHCSVLPPLGCVQGFFVYLGLTVFGPDAHAVSSHQLWYLDSSITLEPRNFAPSTQHHIPATELNRHSNPSFETELPGKDNEAERD